MAAARLTRVGAFCALGMALATPEVSAATVSALALPPGFTVAPEAEQRLVSIGRDHTVAAVAHSVDTTFRTRAFRWSAAGTRVRFEPLAVTTAPDGGRSNLTPNGIGGIAVGPGVVYVSASQSWSGAYSGTSFEVERWIGAVAKRWPLPACAQTDAYDQHANAVDERGRVALTLDITGIGSFGVMRDPLSDHAPYAFVISGNRCRPLGRAVVLALRDRWAAGYRGYLDGRLAPTNLNVIIQREVAVRWHDGVLTELGDGAAMAVARSGLTVGATAVPGRFASVTTNFFGNPGRRYDAKVPRAVAWDREGKRMDVVPGALRSVAYDVADDGTTVGMVQAAGGRHFAFRRHAGRLERLDDLPHPPGWRFESAYAIAPDGTIAGIGTLRGTATVFTWHASDEGPARRP